MNPLLKRLASLRVKVRLLDGWQGICAVVALVLGVGLVVGVADYFLHLPTLFRAVALVGLLVGAGAIVYRYLLRPFGKPCDDLNLALRVEEKYPELNDSLASTVQFLKQSKEDFARLGGSAAMRERTIQEAVDKAAQYDFGRILNRQAAALFGVAALAIVLLASGVVAMNREYASIAFRRFVEPFGGHTWTQMAVYRLKNDKSDRVDAFKPEKVAIKQSYQIKVNLTGQLPANLKQARVEVDAQIRTDSNETITREGDSAYFIKKFNVMDQKQKFKFRIVYNDGAFPPRTGTWHEIEVLPEPKLVALDNRPSPQIALTPPMYTDLPPRQLPPGVRNLDMFEGTRVTYRAKADRPLKDAWLVYQPVNPTVIPGLVFCALGNTDALQVAAGAVPWARIPVKLENQADSCVMAASFVPPLCMDGRYVLYMIDEYDLEGHDSGDLRILKDPVPEINLLKPASSITARPDGQVPFKFNVTDEFFAVKTVYVEYRRKDAKGDLIDEPTRVVLYEGKDFGKLIPEMFTRAGYLNLPLKTLPKPALVGQNLRLRPKKLDFETVWNLKNQFKENELIEIEICADDFCDLDPFRRAGRSTTIELRIVSVRTIKWDAENRLRQILENVKRIAKMEEQALNTVKETKEKDKIDQKDIDKFIDNGETPQRNVKEITGNNPDKGLRKELNDLRQMLKDNKLDGTQTFRDAGAIKGTLDNIAQQELQQIEPKINDIRNELTQNEKNTKATKQKLGETAKLQKNVLDSLNELIRKLEPTAKMDSQKNELRDIIERQQKINQELDEMKAQKQVLEKDPAFEPAKVEKEFKEKVAGKAQEQRELAQQLENLIKEMKAEKQEQEKLGNKENAKKIQDAIEQLEKPKAQPKLQEDNKKEPPVNAQMKAAGKELNNKSEAPNKVLEDQKKIVNELENALIALEGRNEDNTKKDIQDRKMAEKKIDEQIKKLEDLRNELKKIEKIEDEKERLKRKEELAKKIDGVMDNIEETRRELARLQEQRAANDLNNANDKLDKVRPKVENGENPDEDLQKAKENLEQAKDNLRQAEEQLARELLIKIAEQLKAIKDRQDALIQRSEDFHPKIITRKSWTEGTLNTIEGNMDAQKDVAGETDTLKEKLKETKVFSSILEMAKKSMDDAGKAMEARRDEGKLRRYLEKGDGELMDDKELADENEWHGDTVRHQKHASQRLGIILDAIKEEIAKGPKRKKEQPQQAKNDQKDPKEKEPKAGPPPQDFMPPKAELKALKALQVELKEQTEDFARRVPDPAKMTEAQAAELNNLRNEQGRLQELFADLLPRQQPMPKEGDQP
jgi:hypothetical protein